MATHVLGYGAADPVGLVESCYRAVEWILATHAAKGVLIPRPWIDHPYGEEEITLLEEDLLPAMAGFLARVEAIDQAIEPDQEAQVSCRQGRPLAGRFCCSRWAGQLLIGLRGSRGRMRTRCRRSSATIKAPCSSSSL